MDDGKNGNPPVVGTVAFFRIRHKKNAEGAQREPDSASASGQYELIELAIKPRFDVSTFRAGSRRGRP